MRQFSLHSLTSYPSRLTSWLPCAPFLSSHPDACSFSSRATDGLCPIIYTHFANWKIVLVSHVAFPIYVCSSCQLAMRIAMIADVLCFHPSTLCLCAARITALALNRVVAIKLLHKTNQANDATSICGYNTHTGPFFKSTVHGTHVLSWPSVVWESAATGQTRNFGQKPGFTTGTTMASARSPWSIPPNAHFTASRCRKDTAATNGVLAGTE